MGEIFSNDKKGNITDNIDISNYTINLENNLSSKNNRNTPDFQNNYIQIVEENTDYSNSIDEKSDFSSSYTKNENIENEDINDDIDIEFKECVNNYFQQKNQDYLDRLGVYATYSVEFGTKSLTRRIINNEI